MKYPNFIQNTLLAIPIGLAVGFLWMIRKAVVEMRGGK